MAIKIMVVDDEPAIGKLLFHQLSGFGYQVSYIQNGLRALQHLSAEQPDLVLLDVMMPLMSGWEICRQIRAYSQVPVIMLTAKSAELDVVTGLQAGADDYITKPFSMAQLQARIEAVLRRTNAVNSTVQAPGRIAAPAVIPATLPPPALTSEQVMILAAPNNPPPLRLGQHIRATRVAQGISLHQVERACAIRWEFLQAIEQETWDYVPRKELRRALQTYTRYLGIDLPTMIGQPKPTYKNSLVALQLIAIVAVIVIMLMTIGFFFLYHNG